MWRVLLLLGLLSCKPNTVTVATMAQYPGLVQATAIAWAAYGMNGTPPVIGVMEQKDLTCRNSPGEVMSGWGCTGTVHPGCVCRAGNEGGPGGLMVAWINNQPWHEAAVCHEIGHKALGISTGFDHPKHEEPGWGAPLAACNALLVKAGY